MPLPSFDRLAVFSCVLTVSASAAAQELVFDACTSQDGSQYGFAVDHSEALDSQGRPVVVVGAPYFTSPSGGGAFQGEGAVFFSSGAAPLMGDDLQDQFGYAIAASLRLNAQGGRDDLVVGAPGSDPAGLSNAGEFFAYSGSGATLYSVAGTTAGDRLGERVAHAGDIDGDGFDDFLVAAPAPTHGGPGYVLVVSGQTGATLRVHAGLDGAEGFGSGLSGLTDLDGDGAPDYAIGVPGRANATGVPSGVVLLISGTTGALLDQFDGENADELFGFSVATGADLDRDGVHDLAVGLPGADGNDGAVRAFSLADGHELFGVAGVETRGRFGHAVALARDFNGDGFGDVVVGAPSILFNGQPLGAGVVTVVSGADGATLTRYGGGFPGAGAGISVAARRDVDGDGLSDVIVGGVNNSDGYSARGCISIFAGGPAAPVIAGGLDEEVGAAVDGAGDLDGDGIEDVLIGAPLARNGGGARTGAVRVTTARGEVLGEVFGSVTDGEFGRSVASMGDLDGDGIAEFAVGARDDVRVYSGAPGFPLRFALGGNGSDLFGSALASGRDVDGDGVNDLVVGLSPCGASGSIVVFSGATGARVLEFDGGTGACEAFGASVALVDDVNGDGRAEIAVGIPDRFSGAPLFRTGAVDLRSGLDGALLHSFSSFDIQIGTALTRVGDLDGDGISDLVTSWWDPQALSTTGGIHALSSATLTSLWSVSDSSAYSGIGFGYALDSAGDLDGDGIDDVIVGHPGENTQGERASGAAYVHSGASGVRLAEFRGSNGWDYLGYSVAGLGDVDGDGRPDVALGAPTERSNDQGAAPGLNRVRIGQTDPLLAWNFCPLAANGTSSGAMITASGSGRVSAASLRLSVTDAAGPSFGLFVAGAGVNPTPFLGEWISSPDEEVWSAPVRRVQPLPTQFHP
ncbi:MAG: FG-GAP-like repeat-containing protein, partial [Planctomycetota bacterium]